MLAIILIMFDKNNLLTIVRDDISTRLKDRNLSYNEIAKTIETIEQEMREAARNLDFERAMELRDILFEMKSN